MKFSSKTSTAFAAIMTLATKCLSLTRIQLAQALLYAIWLAALSVWASAQEAPVQAAHTQDAPAQNIRAVVELFTSQGCSASPPADQLLGEFARDPSIVALTLPVDYWDYLGWKDTLANPQHSTRQLAYARSRGDRDVATPQVIVNGRNAVLGSDRGAIASAIADTQQTAMSVPVTLETRGGMLNISAGKASHSEHAEVWLSAVTKIVPVVIGRGENIGRALTYYNVGRNWMKVGTWNGQAANWSLPLAEIRRDDANIIADAVAVILQSGDAEKPGPILGAAFIGLP